jgi:nicotinate-nucleotide adenylyltransferase
MQSILLFGGTFDPVHNGHIVMLNAAIDALTPTITLVIPTGQPWQKGNATFASAAERLQMLQLAFPHIKIDERELNRRGPTYTVETLREVSREYPTHQLHWLIGSDSFARLDSWREPAAIAALTEFAVVRRANEVIAPPRVVCRYTEIVASPPPISSTEIRARLKKPQLQNIADCVPAPIYDYIQQHHLYQTIQTTQPTGEN